MACQKALASVSHTLCSQSVSLGRLSWLWRGAGGREFGESVICQLWFTERRVETTFLSVCRCPFERRRTPPFSSDVFVRRSQSSYVASLLPVHSAGLDSDVIYFDALLKAFLSWVSLCVCECFISMGPGQRWCTIKGILCHLVLHHFKHQHYNHTACLHLLMGKRE